MLGPINNYRVAATLAILADPAEADRRPYRGVRPRSATNRAAKSAASLRVAAKMAGRFVERLDRIADTLIAFLLPAGHFRTQRGSRDNC